MKSKFTIRNCFIDKKLNVTEKILEKMILFILYWSTKFHKPVVDKCQSLRLILAAVNITSYEQSKFLIPPLALFEPISYTIKNLLSFAKEVTSSDSKHHTSNEQRWISFSFSMVFITRKMMVQLWAFHWFQLSLIYSYFNLRNSGYLTSGFM